MSSLELESSMERIETHTPNFAMGQEVGGLHVPSEIFAEIFILCLPTSKFVVPSRAAAPLSVSGVCQRWRMAALGAPKLWNSLLLRGRSESVAPESGYLDFCSEWLSRAGGSPLSLSLEASVSTINPLLDRIRGLSQQWQDIELKLDNLQQILSVPRGNYPLLKRISISPPRGGLLISFQDAPKLHDVFLSTYTAHVHLPRHQLTAFWSQDIDVAPFFGILREALYLVNGRFGIRECDYSALPNTVLSLPQLQFLALRQTRRRQFIPSDAIPLGVLNSLKTPALQSLTLTFSETRVSQPVFNISPFLSLVSRSSLQLHTLTISLMPGTTNDMVQCLRVTPSLVHLKLRVSILGFELDTFITQLTGVPHLLPQLESLHLVFPSSSSAVRHTPLTVVEMLRWRWSAAGISQLQSFRLAYNPGNQETDLQRLASHPELKHLEAKGMVLYVGWAVTPIDTF